MPKDSGNMLHTTFTDHFIRIVKGKRDSAHASGTPGLSATQKK